MGEKGVTPAIWALLTPGPIGLIIIGLSYILDSNKSIVRIAYGSGSKSGTNPVSWNPFRTSASIIQCEMPQITDDDWAFMLEFAHGPLQGHKMKNLQHVNQLMMNGVMESVPPAILGLQEVTEVTSFDKE